MVGMAWVIYALAQPRALPNITVFTMAFPLVQQQLEWASVAQSILKG